MHLGRPARACYQQANRVPAARGFAFGIVKNNYGYYKGQALEAWIDGLLTAKTGKSAITFRELHEHSCGQGSCKALRLPATNVNTGRLQWFSADDTPDIKVALAVRASSSIPIFYQPTIITMPDGHEYYFVDGGALRNLPHDAFPLTAEAPGLAFSLRDGGLLGVKKKEKFDGFTDYVKQLYEGLFFGPDSANSLGSAEQALDILPVNADFVESVDFELGFSTKAKLVSTGYAVVRQQLLRCQAKGALATSDGPTGSTGVLPEDPDWLVALRDKYVLLDFASQVTGLKAVTNDDFTDWYNEVFHDLLKPNVVFAGEMDKSGEWRSESFKRRRIELLKFGSALLLMTRLPAEPWKLAKDKVRDGYVVKGGATLTTSGEQTCLKLSLQSIAGLKPEQFQELVRGDGGGDEVELTLCGRFAFGAAFCNVRPCVDEVAKKSRS
eukprot:TRINITY_DN45305_c0_g1_i2.p1 TRINITY_DN45305_c0_g1~~TRINITY_DN45305_c0_g1_i2.p1  ORF type:complete len:439 (-),score=65.05 TRINITY_DN45305_c0_g1_i2:140-1456(-)